MLKKLRNVYWAAGAAMLLYYLMIGVAVRFGLDMAWMWLVVGGALILAGCACMVRLPRWVRWIWRAGLCAGIALVIALEGLVISGMNAVPPQGLDYLIVLGAKVEENGRPSKALQHRIEAAAAYLLENPGTIAIASGGRGEDEDMTEAACIRNGLLDLGISEERILMEEESTTTAENMAFSAALAPMDSETQVGIVTNNFHVFRALKLAEKAGYKRVSGLAADYAGLTLLHYMMREGACTLADALLGNL